MEGTTSSPRTPDGMLAMSARAGDMQAFGELYHRHARAIYDFLLRTLHDPAVAADLTQSTFRRAFGRFGGLRDADRVRAWLFTIAYHLAVTQMRRGPVPPMVEEPPLAAVPAGPSQPGAVEQLDSAQLVWTAASSIGPELYAMLDLTARQGVDLVDLGDGIRMERHQALALLEQAHEAFGHATRELVLEHGEEWCPGLATLLQGPEAGGAEQAQEVDEHLGRCPRCRPLAERLTSSSTLAGLPLFELPHELAREGWDQLLGDLTRASPRATQGRVVDSAPYGSPQAGDDQPAGAAAAAAAVGYASYRSSGGPALPPTERSSMMRHDAVRRYHAQAEHARMRRSIGAGVLATVLFGGVIAGAVLLSNRHPSAAVTTTIVPSTLPGTTRPAPSSSSHPTTTRPRTTTTVRRHPTTTTVKPSTTTTLLLPPPVTSSISPSNGFPGAAIVVNGFGFQPNDFVAFTGPTYPGQTELITPSSESPSSIGSAIPSFASFAGQKIVVTVRDPSGRFQGSATFLVLSYYSAEWTATGGKVSLTPTTAKHGATRDGQINLFATDVEGDQCMVDDSMPVYAPVGTGPPIAAVAKNGGCPAAEFAISTH